MLTLNICFTGESGEGDVEPVAMEASEAAGTDQAGTGKDVEDTASRARGRPCCFYRGLCSPACNGI